MNNVADAPPGWLTAPLETLPGSSIDFKPEWDCWVMWVAGKMFGLWSTHADYGEIVTLKGDPEDNEALRLQYESVIPGYHTNKRHWNTVMVERGEVPEPVLVEMVEDAYDAVVTKLPKAVREALG